MDDFRKKIEEIMADDVYKLVLSKPRDAGVKYRKIDIEKKERGFLLARYTQKQVFHETVGKERLADVLVQLMDSYGQLNAWSGAAQYQLLVSKKGKVSYKRRALDKETGAPKAQTSHNRQKKYIIEEGTVVPPLVDMGIFTAEGKIVRTMYDKFRQINRFIELIDDSVKKLSVEHLRIIDFGCGKSYLTFILYYYLKELCHIPVDITGLDLKEDVIKKCNEAAEKYGYSHLHFELGDINGYQCKEPVDMVITLHACDVATDYALYNAVTWKAKMIFSVPCCQHELNGQIASDGLSLLTRYGIVKERFSALATDAIRANMLEYAGYKVQLLEFVDLSHTPKNILIRAIRRPVMPKEYRQKMRAEAEAFMEEFQTGQKLYELLT